MLRVMDYQSFRTNGNVTVHDVPEPELFVEGDPVLPIEPCEQGMARLLSMQSNQGCSVHSRRHSCPANPVRLQVTKCVHHHGTNHKVQGHASSRYRTDECCKRFAELVESEKEEAKAKKAANEEIAKSSKSADETAATCAAKASSLEPPQNCRPWRGGPQDRPWR